METTASQSIRHLVQRVGDGKTQFIEDSLAIEAPLEIRLVAVDSNGLIDVPISITMRTPGNDAELAVGFLIAEGVLRSRDDLVSIKSENEGTLVRVRLSRSCSVDWDRFQRHVLTNSSCGICGNTMLSSLTPDQEHPLNQGPLLTENLIGELPQRLRQSQKLFSQTGGVHASGLFNAEGHLLRLAEDVGRHNALDKVIGGQWLDDPSVFRQSVLVVSGRVSYELVQKAIVAGIPVLLAVGAPSSLAVELATRFHLTLIGFVKPHTYNVYHDRGRIERPQVCG
jgi:FdhD protein